MNDVITPTAQLDDARGHHNVCPAKRRTTALGRKAITAWFLCTRPAGHDGDHVARGLLGETYLRWERGLDGDLVMPEWNPTPTQLAAYKKRDAELRAGNICIAADAETLHLPRCIYGV